MVERAKTTQILVIAVDAIRYRHSCPRLTIIITALLMHPHHIAIGPFVVDDFGAFDLGVVQIRVGFIGENIADKFPIFKIARTIKPYAFEGLIVVAVFTVPIVKLADLDHARAVGMQNIAVGIAQGYAIFDHRR